MLRLRLAPLAGALLLAAAVAGCGSSSRTAGGADRPSLTTTERLDLSGTSPSNTVLENAMAVAELSMLVAAVQQAGLTDDLSGVGPYTLFAPLNSAFEGADVSPEELEDVLLYHVVDGEVMAGDLDDGMVLVTMSGEEANVNTSPTDPLSFNIDDADIVYTDIESSNGVIHLINLVLNPIPGGMVDPN